MRLIDADELAEKLKGLKEYIDKISINREARCLVDVTQVIEYVENAPTVEATTRRTEYIYCKECIYNMNWICTMKNEKIKPTTLCLYGKKKRGGNNDKRK